MKQLFTKKEHNNFKNYFSIKEKPGKWDKNYIKKTEKYLKYIKWIPGLKMVGVGNSTSMNYGKESSDIDLYIVTEKNRMWFVRITITIIFQILGVRKTAKKHAGRFCLSFFSTIDGMDFSSFAIKNDIYLYFWTIYFKPILDYENTYSLFLEENNSWADFSNYLEIIEENKKYITFKRNKQKSKNSFMLNNIEKLLKKIFLGKTKRSFQKLGKPFGVIITDDLLKFHDNDIRKNISKQLF